MSTARACARSYQRYKEICAPVAEIEARDLCANGTSDELRDRHRTLRRCRRAREQHEARCIPLVDRDEGHRYYLEKVSGLERVCEESLVRAYEEEAAIVENDYDYFEEENEEVARGLEPVDTACDEAREMREGVCTVQALYPDTNLVFQHDEDDRLFYLNEVEPRLFRTARCVQAIETEERVCGSSSLSSLEVSRRSEATQARYNAFVRGRTLVVERKRMIYLRFRNSSNGRELLLLALAHLRRYRALLSERIMLGFDDRVKYLQDNITTVKLRRKMRASLKTERFGLADLRLIVKQKYPNLRPLLAKLEQGDLPNFADLGLLVYLGFSSKNDWLREVSWGAVDTCLEYLGIIYESVTLLLSEKASEGYEYPYEQELINYGAGGNRGKTLEQSLFRLSFLERFVREQYAESLRARP